MPDLAMLETFVDESIAAIKSGNLSRLDNLSDSASAAMNRNGAADAPAATRLRIKALHNQSLIAAAIKGVKAARQRAKDLASAGQFSTYDAAGQRNHVGNSALPAVRRV